MRPPQNRTTTAISDLNGDGRADLVTADQFSNTVSVLLNLGGTTAVGDAPTPSVALLGISPNPAVGELHVSFSLTEAGPAELALYDVAGRKVASREVGHLGVGRHMITLSREGMTAGVYFLRLSRGATKLTARVVLVR
jgi:hypothetical protein